MYRDGMREEGLISNAGPTSQSPGSGGARQLAGPPASTGSGAHERILDEQVHRDGGTTITERSTGHDLSNRPGEFGALGFKEVTLKR